MIDSNRQLRHFFLPVEKNLCSLLLSLFLTRRPEKVFCLFLLHLSCYVAKPTLKTVTPLFLDLWGGKVLLSFDPEGPRDKGLGTGTEGNGSSVQGHHQEDSRLR